MPLALVIRRYIDDGLHEAGDTIELTPERFESLKLQGLVIESAPQPEAEETPIPESSRKGKR
jgi:hypothetical protein